MNEKLSGSKKYILVIADCYYGRMHAGRFAVKNLFDNNSIIILLQTYQPPQQRKEMSNGISPLLKKIAERELREFKARLLGEFDLPSSKVQVMVREGDLKDIIDRDFSSLPGLSIVIGSINEGNSNRVPCWNVICSLMEASVRPVFLITKCIAVIEKSRILVIAGKGESGIENYLSFMRELKNKFNFCLEIITPETSKKIAMDENTAGHFNIHKEPESRYLSPSEQVFYDRVISVSPLKG